MFGLDKKYILFIKNTLKKTLDDNAKVYIFGSRAKGKYSEYSDVDIAIDSPDFDFNTKLKLQLEFENSTFPYKVDLINLNEVNEKWKAFNQLETEPRTLNVSFSVSPPQIASQNASGVAESKTVDFQIKLPPKKPLKALIQKARQIGS